MHLATANPLRLIPRCSCKLVGRYLHGGLPSTAYGAAYLDVSEFLVITHGIINP